MKVGDTCTKSADCGNPKFDCWKGKCRDTSKVVATTQISEKDDEENKKKIKAAQDKKYVDFRNKQNRVGQKGTVGSMRYWANLNKNDPEFKAKGVKGTVGSKKWWARQQRLKKGKCKMNSECTDGKVCKNKKCVPDQRYKPRTEKSDAAWAELNASAKSDFTGEAGDFCTKPSDCTLDGYDPAVWTPACVKNSCTHVRKDGKPGAANNVNRTNRLQGQTCTADGECQAGLRCEIGRGERKRTCKGTKQAGEECVKDSDCTSRGYDPQIYKTSCTQNKCKTTMIDAKRLEREKSKKKLYGTPCTGGNECGSGLCSNNKCAFIPDATLKKQGASCKSDYDCITKNCKNKKCGPMRPNAPSTGPTPAPTNTESMPAPVKRAIGEPCDNYSQCASSICYNKKCADEAADFEDAPAAPRKKAQGETCTDTSECQPLTDAEKRNKTGQIGSKISCETGSYGDWVKKCRRVFDITSPKNSECANDSDCKGDAPGSYYDSDALQWKYDKSMVARCVNNACKAEKIPGYVPEPPGWQGTPDRGPLLQEKILDGVKDAANAVGDFFKGGNTFADSQASQFFG